MHSTIFARFYKRLLLNLLMVVLFSANWTNIAKAEFGLDEIGYSATSNDSVKGANITPWLMLLRGGNNGSNCSGASNDSCPSAIHLGTITDNIIVGDIEASVTGKQIGPVQSLWFHLFAADNFGDSWKALIKLYNISPTVNLDLYAYRRASGNTCQSSPIVGSGSCNEDISGCGGAQENSNRCSTNSGNEPECVSWYESCTGLLELDETEIWIEVRNLSNSCGTFDLKVRNNGNNDSLTCANY